MKKIMFLDTETTGLDGEHGIVQIAGVIDINMEKKHEFDILTNLYPGDKINARALEVNKRTHEEIQGFQPSYMAKAAMDATMQRYVSKFDKKDKFYMVGYNTGFDHMMMSAWYKKHGDSYMMSYFFYPIIDVAQMAALYMEVTGEKKKLENFKLGTLGMYLGLIKNTDELHNALADINLTRDIFYVCIRPMMAGNGMNLQDHAQAYMEQERG